MTIKEYLEKHGMTQDELAELCNVRVLTIHRWVNKKTWPDPRSLKTIMEVTNGEVTPNDIFI